MRVLALVLAGGLTLSAQVQAQFGISAELGLGFMGGTSQDTATAGVGSLRPYRPTQYSVRPDWQFGRWRVGLGLLFSRPTVAIEGAYTFVANDSARATLVEAAPEVVYRLLRTSTGVSLHLHAGPVVDVWSVLGEDKLVGGGQLALSVEMPLAGRVHLLVRASGVVTKSVFDKTDVPPEWEVQPMRRGTISLGVRYGP